MGVGMTIPRLCVADIINNKAYSPSFCSLSIPIRPILYLTDLTSFSAARSRAAPALLSSYRTIQELARSVQVLREQGSSKVSNIMTGPLEGKSLKVGFLGLGIMGVAMARNLVKAGYHVTVWNRSPGKCKELEQEGASVASSSAECVAANDITIVMLADPAAALAVAKDAVKGISAGKGYVDVSTVDPQTAQQICQVVTEAGGSYLEAPVGGSKQPAEQGNLVFLCGGDKALFDKCAPLLDVMGKAKFFLGEVGRGSQMKLIINMMLGAIMTVNAEGIALAQSLGLQVEEFIEVVNLGAMGTPMFKLKASAMAEGEYPTAFPLKHAQKDVRLALAAAQEKGLSLPVASAANGQYMKAIEGGLGDADFSAVMETLNAKAA